MADEQRLELDDDYVHLRSQRRIDILVRLILTFVIVALLLAPSAVLFLVRGHGKEKLVLILGFTLVFAACVSIFTKAKRQVSLAYDSRERYSNRSSRHELFASTSA